MAASRAPLSTTVHAPSLARYPEEIETAVYFCCMEALQNACKHAGESVSVSIAVHQDADALVFEVADDGSGFDPDAQAPGAGFVNMGDRLGTLGGSLRVESAPGRGTKVTGTLPALLFVDDAELPDRPDMTKIDDGLVKRLAAMKADRPEHEIPVIVTVRPGADVAAMEGRGLTVERTLGSVSAVAGTVAAHELESLAALDDVRNIEYDGEIHAL